MSVARFLILAGPGDRYHGDGMQPQALLSMYDDKAVWLMDDLRKGGRRRSFSSGEFLFDDAMLTLALYAFRWLWEQTPELPQAVQEVFGTVDLDAIEKKLTAARRPAQAKMKKLYEASRLAWRKQRIVRLYLHDHANQSNHRGGRRERKRECCCRCGMYLADNQPGELDIESFRNRRQRQRHRQLHGGGQYRHQCP